MHAASQFEFAEFFAINLLCQRQVQCRRGVEDLKGQAAKVIRIFDNGCVPFNLKNDIIEIFLFLVRYEDCHWKDLVRQ